MGAEAEPADAEGWPGVGFMERRGWDIGFSVWAVCRVQGVRCVALGAGYRMQGLE